MVILRGKLVRVVAQGGESTGWELHGIRVEADFSTLFKRPAPGAELTIRGRFVRRHYLIRGEVDIFQALEQVQTPRAEPWTDSQLLDCQGAYINDIVAIGGETTGEGLAQAAIEIDARSIADRGKLENRMVEVRGHAVRLHGPERGCRCVLQAESISLIGEELLDEGTSDYLTVTSEMGGINPSLAMITLYSDGRVIRENWSLAHPMDGPREISRVSPSLAQELIGFIANVPERVQAPTIPVYNVTIEVRHAELHKTWRAEPGKLPRAICCAIERLLPQLKGDKITDPDWCADRKHFIVVQDINDPATCRIVCENDNYLESYHHVYGPATNEECAKWMAEHEPED